MFLSLSLALFLFRSPGLCLYGSLRLAVLHMLLCPYQCLSVSVCVRVCVCLIHLSVCCFLCTHTRQEPSDVKRAMTL